MSRYNVGMPIQRSIDYRFFKKWSPRMSYVLGFFAADGNMIRNRRGAHFIAFYSCDKSILLAIRSALGSTHKLGIRRRSLPWRTAYQLQIGSKDIFSDLVKLGFMPAKSDKLRMPPVPKKFLSDFVRGYFDGDGCVYFKKLKFADRKRPRLILQTIFTCGSRPFLLELQKILQEKGVIGGSIRNKTRGFDLLFSHKDSVALYKFMYHTVSVTDFYLPRKYKIFRTAIETLYPDAVVV